MHCKNVKVVSTNFFLPKNFLAKCRLVDSRGASYAYLTSNVRNDDTERIMQSNCTEQYKATQSDANGEKR